MWWPEQDAATQVAGVVLLMMPMLMLMLLLLYPTHSLRVYSNALFRPVSLSSWAQAGARAKRWEGGGRIVISDMH
jgi:hypothetical protein